MPYFCITIFLTFQTQSLFKQDSVSLSFLPSNWQLKVGWGTDSSDTEVFDFTTIPFTIIVSCNHLNNPWLNFGNGIFSYVLIIKSGFLFMWYLHSHQSWMWKPSCLMIILRQILGSNIYPDRVLNPSLPVHSQIPQLVGHGASHLKQAAVVLPSSQ